MIINHDALIYIDLVLLEPPPKYRPLGLDFVCESGGEGRGGFWKKEWASGRNRGNGRWGFWGVNFSS